MIDEKPGQPRLVVYNTFLEVDDKQDGQAGGRPRAQTDITERKMPRKISYHVDEAQQMCEESPSAFGKLGPLSEDFPTDPNQVVQGLSMGLGAHPGSSMAAAAAAAQLGHPLLPSMPAPGYYPGLPPAWPPWGHPPQGFPSPALPPHLGSMGSMAPGVWPYPLPYPGLDPALAAMAQAATGPATPGVPGIARSAQGNSKGRGRGGRTVANGRKASSDSPAQTPAPAPIEIREAPAVARNPPEPPVNGTTVMLRNLPSRFTQESILQLLNEQGFEAKYDFVYLPMDFRNGTNLGYAFVNTLTHEDALRAMEVFQGFGSWTCDSEKVCEVSWAHPHQGFQEHVERYRNSPVMHAATPEEYKPMIFANGQRVPFPAPTKAIRAPKLKHNPSGGPGTDAQS
mmetsp:Transcript_41259/g.76762  ORF Transcript_41259/g.76762 Transcript_41259/m.76762 type:complete len:397 (-) Transcript_41259:146-1336(-)